MARSIADVLAWLAFLLSATAMAARFVPIVNHAVLITSGLSLYLSMAGAGLAVALLVANRRWWVAALAFAFLLAAVGVQLPRFIHSRVATNHTIAVRVLAANIFEGKANPDSLAAAARSRADILIIEELTPTFAAALQRLHADFPYQAVHSSEHANGVGIWSRYPLGSATRVAGYGLGMISVAVVVPGAANDVVVLAVHLAGPWPQPIDSWRQEIGALPNTLRRMAEAAGDSAVIAAGDFNATTDMQPFRRLLDNGYQDAATRAGAGLVRTYPANRSIPPLIGIDHILIRNSSASDVQTVGITGTDHLAVSGTIHVPGKGKSGE